MKFLSKKNKIDNQTFVEFVNKQLEPHNITYTDVRDDADWFMKYTTTKQQQNKFIDWAVYYLINKNNMPTKKAEEEVSWFILQYGLSLNKKQLSL
tara:strand:- start:1501 stop:1785 length:285 start_codon:yes stop_codon:yes gene_type:complete